MSVATKALLLLLALPVFYVSSCSYVDWSRTHGFEATKMGDSETVVLERLGSPSRRMPAGHAFPRYADTGCSAPCATRLWYENRLFLDIEAWSIDLDSTGHVTAKFHWVSP
jgi:hypothetical protein